MDTTQIVILVVLVVAVATLAVAYGYRRRGGGDIRRRGREPAHPTDASGYETASRPPDQVREDMGSVGHPQDQRGHGTVGGTPLKGGNPPQHGGGGTSDISQR